MRPRSEVCGHRSHQSSSPGQHVFVPVLQRMLQCCLPREHLPSPLGDVSSLGQAPQHRRCRSGHQLAESPCAHKGSLFSPGAGQRMPRRACTEAALLVLPGLQPLFGLDRSTGAETWSAPPSLTSGQGEMEENQRTSSCREPLPRVSCSFSPCIQSWGLRDAVPQLEILKAFKTSASPL